MAVELPAAATVTGGLSKNSFLLFFKRVLYQMTALWVIMWFINWSMLVSNKTNWQNSQQLPAEVFRVYGVGKIRVRLCPDLTQMPVPWLQRLSLLQQPLSQGKKQIGTRRTKWHTKLLDTKLSGLQFAFFVVWFFFLLWSLAHTTNCAWALV